MNTSLWMANTPGHWATMSSILIWKISCDILSPKGTHRNLYLLRWVLNIVRSEASSERCIPNKALLPSTFGEFGGSCEDVSYLLEGWSFVVLMDDCLVQVLGVKTDLQLAICLFGVCQAADPWCVHSLLGDDSLVGPSLLAPF